MRFLAAAAFALALTWAPSAQQPRTRPPQRPAAPPKAHDAIVPFQIGETLTYDVSWSQFVTAGTAVTRVVDKKPASGSNVYSIVADGRPVPLVARFYPLYYKMESLVDTATLLAWSSSVYQEERSAKRLATTRFDRINRRAHYEVQSEPPVRAEFDIAPNVQDGLASLYAVRSHSFKRGDHLTVPVADDGSLYIAEFDVGAPERVRVPFAETDAWNVQITIVDAQGKPAATNVRAWISTDARRLPLKLQAEVPIGSFVLALRDMQP
jgi:hypothetical protein